MYDEAALVPPVLPAHLRRALQLRAAGHQLHPRLTRGTSARRHAAHVATWPAAGTARPRVAAMYTSSSCSTRRDACPGHASSHLRTFPLQLTRVSAACPAAVLPAAVRLAHQLHGVSHRVALHNGQYQSPDQDLPLHTSLEALLWTISKLRRLLA